MARSKAFIPEVIEPDEKLPPDLVALRKFSILMDEALPVPGTKRRIGLDAGLGLIPGIGDIVSALLSAWIVVGALRHRVPARRIARMVANIVLDVVVGAVPFLGDIFDFVYEENVANMRLLMQYRNRRLPPRTTGQMAGMAFLIVFFILGTAILVVGLMAAAVFWLIAHRNG
jgi:hypothetical protein